jgi:hypothetical protein
MKSFLLLYLYVAWPPGPGAALPSMSEAKRAWALIQLLLPEDVDLFSALN